MYWTGLPFALVPAALHWWWSRSIIGPSASAIRAERILAISQRVSFVLMACTIAIVVIARWHASWLLPLECIALAASTHRLRRALFGETWTFCRYLSWRVRLHVGMFGLWWCIALAPVLVAQASSRGAWWLAALSTAIALAWHHWAGRVLLTLLRAAPLDRPDLDDHFQRVFASATVSKPDLWHAGVGGGRVANAFALLTSGHRGVLFFDGLLEQLTPEEITAILAHEIAHLEQFNRHRLFRLHLATTVLIVLLMAGSALGAVLVPDFKSWAWVLSVAGVCGAIALRAHRMQARETDADIRATQLCGDPEALIRALIRIHEINHVPRRMSALLEERATHPSLARRIRAIRDRGTGSQPPPPPPTALIVVSSEPGRCAVLEQNRIAFAWFDGQPEDEATVLDRANRVERIGYDQLSELRVSATRGRLTLIAIDHHARRWSMPLLEADAARVQAALDSVDHLVTALAPKAVFRRAPRASLLLVMLLAASFHAIAALAPGLLALRRPKRSLLLALAGALAGTAIASVNELDVPLVRILLLGILSLAVLWNVRRAPQLESEPDPSPWIWIERLGLLVPVLVGLVVTVANSQDLFGLHAAIRDRTWFTAALAAVAVFCFVQTGQRTVRRSGLSVAVLATAAIVVGSPWFMLHAVADPLVAEMPSFRETTASVLASSQRVVNDEFSEVRLTPAGRFFVLFGHYDETDDETTELLPPRFLVAGFDDWAREIRAFDVAAIDEERLLVLERARASSRLRTEHLITGQTMWTIELPDLDVFTVQASPDGRWRAFARRGHQFDRLDGHVGEESFTRTRWMARSDRNGYVDMPRSDGGNAALAVSSLWRSPTPFPALTDLRTTTRLLRLDGTGTTELASSHMSVECPGPAMDTRGYVCVASDGRTSRLWRVDLTSGTLTPTGETRRTLWRTVQLSQHRLAGLANGQPILVDLDSRTLVTLDTDPHCWAMDVSVVQDFAASVCSDGQSTRVARYRLPGSIP